MSDAIGDRKRTLRRRMRRVRLALDGRTERSVAIWAHVRAQPSVREAEAVMVYAAVPGEPDAAGFVVWCRRAGKRVVVPESDPTAPMPAEPRSLDVVVVPGLAFTAAGDRLGQGGGWYDRFLVEVAASCTTIGVGFAAQLVDELPVGDHDVRLDVVITEDGPVRPPGGG